MNRSRAARGQNRKVLEDLAKHAKEDFSLRTGEDARPPLLCDLFFFQELIGSFGLSRVFRVLARFGKVGIGVLDAGVLVAVPQLAIQAGIAAVLTIFWFKCTLMTILVFVSRHEGQLPVIGLAQRTELGTTQSLS